MADYAVDAGMAPRTTAARLKAVFGGSSGNFVEWFDWFSYSVFALYFADVFFPKADQTVQLLQAAAVFAVGFLIRPFGSWIMGYYADRVGRRKALLVSMLVMGVGSLGIGITPGYASIGVFAPILLLLARLLQGLSMGGQYGSCATYLSEAVGPERRGFWSSFQYVTLIMGQLAATGLLIVLQATLTPEDLAAWGWRVPFILGALSALAAARVLLGLEETRSFKTITTRVSFTAALRGLVVHRTEVLTVMGLTIGGSVSYYAFTAYMQKFLANTVGFSKDTATQITGVALLIFMLLQPLVGWISDRVGRKPLLITFGICGTVLTFPLMTAIGGTHDPLLALPLVVFGMAMLSPYTAISGLVKAELFPAHIRALGVGLPYAIIGSVFGGTTEFVALSFKQAGVETAFYWYVTACMAVSLVTALVMREPQATSRIEA